MKRKTNQAPALPPQSSREAPASERITRRSAPAMASPYGNQLSSFLSENRRRSMDRKRNLTMLLAVPFANTDRNILIERFHGVPAKERLHWRSFLVKLGAENPKGAKNEELSGASHKSVYMVYTMLGDICMYVVGKDEYDELALAEVIFAITSSAKDVCGKPPTERLFLDKYGKICRRRVCWR